MNPEDKKEIIKIFNEGFEQVILPQIVNVHTRLDRMEDKLDDHGNSLDRIERKLNSVVDRQDRHSIEISALKDKPA